MRHRCRRASDEAQKHVSTQTETTSEATQTADSAQNITLGMALVRPEQVPVICSLLHLHYTAFHTLVQT